MAGLKRQVPAIDTFPQSFQISQLSIFYNIGEGNYSKSSMKRYTNAGQPKKACDAMPLWNKSDGVVRKGLINRRKAERALCLQDL
jgi:lysozyme